MRGKDDAASLEVGTTLGTVAMAATSPLPRWWSLGCGEDAAHHEPAGGRGRWWSLGSGIFAWATAAGGRRQRGAPSSNGTAGGGVPGSGCELVAPPADAGDPRAFLTWEDVHVTVAGGGPRGAPDVKILDGISGHARPRGGAGHHRPVRGRQDDAARHPRRCVRVSSPHRSLPRTSICYLLSTMT